MEMEVVRKLFCNMGAVAFNSSVWELFMVYGDCKVEIVNLRSLVLKILYSRCPCLSVYLHSIALYFCAPILSVAYPLLLYP